jgi:single-stranded DNA-binding protein
VALTAKVSSGRTGSGRGPWGSKAEYVQRFTKGQRVLVVGRLEISEWQTRDGETRTSYDIWADDVVNLSPREDGGRRQGESGISGRNDRQSQPADDTTDLDELPV